MSLSAQVKLLRVLQDGEFTRVGGKEVLKTDARVIAASNINLEEAVETGSFRKDLFYRLSVFPIVVPPLRERPEDIHILVFHFLEQYKQKTGRFVSGISKEALRALVNYEWHGNVRELEHTIERAVALERQDEIQPERLTDNITNYNPERLRAEFSLPETGIDLVSHLDNLEKTYVVEALRKTGGNQTKAAELLHIQVRSLRHLLDKHSIRSLSAQMRNGE